jgi:NAD-dependent oxidoreductase involved in siderophore biosynthesis
MMNVNNRTNVLKYSVSDELIVKTGSKVNEKLYGRRVQILSLHPISGCYTVKLLDLSETSGQSCELVLFDDELEITQ